MTNSYVFCEVANSYKFFIDLVWTPVTVGLEAGGLGVGH